MWELESGEWVFLHLYFASSLILLWDLSLAGFCGLIKYSENLISFKTLDLSLQQMMIGGIMTILVESNLRWGQKTKGLLEPGKWVLIGMSAKSVHFHLLLSFQSAQSNFYFYLLENQIFCIHQFFHADWSITWQFGVHWFFRSNLWIYDIYYKEARNARYQYHVHELKCASYNYISWSYLTRLLIKDET